MQLFIATCTHVDAMCSRKTGRMTWAMPRTRLTQVGGQQLNSSTLHITLMPSERTDAEVLRNGKFDSAGKN